jgi:hypothetical protein
VAASRSFGLLGHRVRLRQRWRRCVHPRRCATRGRSRRGAPPVLAARAP